MLVPKTAFLDDIALCKSENKTIQFNGCSLFWKVPFSGSSVERAYASIFDGKMQTLYNMITRKLRPYLMCYKKDRPRHVVSNNVVF